MTTYARDLELATLSIEREDRVLTVRVCDPAYNFMTARMQKDLTSLRRRSTTTRLSGR